MIVEQHKACAEMAGDPALSPALSRFDECTKPSPRQSPPLP